MTPANLPSGQYLLIDVPEGVPCVSIHKGYLVLDMKESGLRSKESKISRGDTNGFIQLPPGSYELIGKGDAVTEDQAAGIVERYVYSGKSSYYAYKDYWGQKPQSEDDIFTTALSSFNSWIRSHGKELSKIVVIKKL